MYTSLPLWVKVLPFYAVIIVMVAVPIRENYVRVSASQSHTVQLKKRLTLPAAVPEKLVIRADAPRTITISSVGIDLPVVNGSIDAATNRWQVSTTAANYAVTSPTPNTEQGWTFIYAHWTRKLFGTLSGVKQGDIAIIETIDDHVFEYRYDSSRIVAPTDIAAINGIPNKKGLVLMTCTGLWAEKRLIQYYTLEDAR